MGRHGRTPQQEHQQRIAIVSSLHHQVVQVLADWRPRSSTGLSRSSHRTRRIPRGAQSRRERGHGLPGTYWAGRLECQRLGWFDEAGRAADVAAWPSLAQVIRRAIAISFVLFGQGGRWSDSPSRHSSAERGRVGRRRSRVFLLLCIFLFLSFSFSVEFIVQGCITPGFGF